MIVLLPKTSGDSATQLFSDIREWPVDHEVITALATSLGSDKPTVFEISDADLLKWLPTLELLPTEVVLAQDVPGVMASVTWSTLPTKLARRDAMLLADSLKQNTVAKNKSLQKPTTSRALADIKLKEERREPTLDFIEPQEDLTDETDDSASEA